jgi:glycosyltransferase involved in cell wall biosynthesis
VQLPASGPQLRIAFFCPELPQFGSSNGIITYCRIMRDALRGLGHEVMLVSKTHVEYCDHGVAELPPPKTWHRLLGRRYKNGFADVANAFSMAKRCGAQIFEIEESFGWAGLLHGIPIVGRLHGPNGFSSDYYNREREAAEMASLNKLRAVTSPSAKLLEAIRNRYGVHLPRAVVIPNPMPRAYDEWDIDRANLDQILFVGRLDRTKGADIAVAAFAKARERRPSLKMIMVGPGDPIEVPEGVTLAGNLTPKRITELRLESGLALSCARSETFSYAVAEAMAVGMPVLSTNTFGPSEIIRDGVDGRLVPVENPEITTRVILEMLSDSAVLAQIGHAAAARVSEYMSPGRIASDAADLYRRLCHPPSYASMALRRLRSVNFGKAFYS